MYICQFSLYEYTNQFPLSIYVEIVFCVPFIVLIRTYGGLDKSENIVWGLISLTAQKGNLVLQKLLTENGVISLKIAQNSHKSKFIKATTFVLVLIYESTVLECGTRFTKLPNLWIIR